ncbi:MULTISPECIES: acetyl-CoA C-acetyltransferase [Candidatus Ichthyocystis]|uniref:Acetyl-CoA acetyltransferase n=1 Tax=Candidatus Ichthyocystis hellenicum TaxID=1561003 RepID=A0A0S4M0S3_9BURK|nr:MULTISPECIES: acetyl-CoA C-acetyltransferase [Ichthyocystis]CUT17413.1 acetyl-CoA acetyltransferase [Candidatus Ichthyocystis hellenicum]
MSHVPVYLVDGLRTPFLKSRNVPGPFSASDLAVFSGRSLLMKQPFLSSQLSEVIVGCAIPAPTEPNIGRYIALRLGCGYKVPGWTVMRNCASGLQSIDSAFSNVLLGRSDIVLAGGTDALSRAPLIFNRDMTLLFSRLALAKTLKNYLVLLSKFRLSFLKPIIALMEGLTEPTTGEMMGQTAENLAHKFGISRQQMDEYSVRSNLRAFSAQETGFFASEITPIFDQEGIVYERDDGIRSDSSVEKLAKLKPVFDRKYGQVTAANSSQVTDGAAFVLIASEESVEKFSLSPLARIVGIEWSALDPSLMGLGPLYSIANLLRKYRLSLSDIGAWEINEAFAAQVIACLEAAKDSDFCSNERLWEGALGTIPEDRLNIDGGSISLGHPVGASGARITLHLANVMHRLDVRYGVASICIGGGMGGSVLLEKV